MKKILIFYFAFFIGENSISQTWHPLGNGVGYVGQMKVINGNLYAVGLNWPGLTCAKGIASFDGHFWYVLGNVSCDTNPNSNDGPGVYGSAAYSLEYYNNEIVCGGGFLYAGALSPGVPNTRDIAAFNGTNWHSLNNYSNYLLMNDQVNCLSIFQGKLFLAGRFIQCGPVGTKYIANYDGTNWNAVGGGVQNSTLTDVYCMGVYNNQLYVGGMFDRAGGVGGIYVNQIARWNGTQWDSVGSGLAGYPYCMYTDTLNNVLYVGGYFTMAGTDTTFCIAKWDGAQWSRVGNNAPVNSVRAITRFNGDLYVGGAQQVAKFDGTNWTVVATLVGGVNAMCVYNGNLYVGGQMPQLDSMQVNGIACYGNNCPLDVGIKKYENDLQFKIFPNPSGGEITIQTDKDENYNIKITDSYGQQILNKKFRKELKENIPGLSKGIYFVEVCDENGKRCHTEKMVVN